MAALTSTFVRRSVALLVAGAFALLVAVGGALVLADATRSSAEHATISTNTRQEAYRLVSLMQDAETGQRGYLLTGNASYLEPYTRARNSMPVAIESLRRALAAEGRADQLGQIPVLAQGKLAELQRTIDLFADGRREDALRIVDSGVGKRLMDELRQQVGAIVTRTDARNTAETQALLENGRMLTGTTLVGGVLTIVFVLIAGWGALAYTRELVAARAEVEALAADLEQRVLARTADLTRANEEIQRFAYIVSHDLRAPLVNVMGFTSELEEGLADVGRYFDAPAPRDAALEDSARRAVREDMPEAIGFVRSSTRKMDGLINAILKISREGGRVLRPERLDVKALIERQAGALRHQLDAKGATVEMAGTWPAIVCDRLALEQIFGNLVDNAVKYLRPDTPGRIHVEGRDLGSRFEVRVRDNGRGIGSQDLERVFELFRRAGTQDVPGEGIGLAHVRALIRRLGGEITVDSRLDVGTTFTVVLPKSTHLESMEPA